MCFLGKGLPCTAAPVQKLRGVARRSLTQVIHSGLVGSTHFHASHPQGHEPEHHGWREEGSGRGTARAEDAQRTPTQSHVSPSILVYEEKTLRTCAWFTIGPYLSSARALHKKPLVVRCVDWARDEPAGKKSALYTANYAMYFLATNLPCTTSPVQKLWGVVRRHLPLD